MLEALEEPESVGTLTSAAEPDESASGPLPVLELIRDAIVNAEFVPDQRLVEADLSERFVATRSAVRSALMQLAAEGLVERIPHRGARVRAVSLTEAIEIVEVRMAVEGLCAAKAAERITDVEAAQLQGIGVRMATAVAAGDTLDYASANRLLHQRIRDLSGQATAVQVLERLRAQSVHHHFGRRPRPDRPAESLGEHLQIIDAICAHDPAAAERAIREHLVSVLDGLVAIRAIRASVDAVELPAPSDRAREIVGGAYDVHVHVAPDLARHGVDDLTLAPRFAGVGLAGFVLQSDYSSTAERAAVVRGAVPGFDAVGAITLNGAVGGMNPVAVELAGRSGAQVVWVPTLDGERSGAVARLEDELRAADMAADPPEIVGPDGAVSPATLRVLRVVARHDMTLAVGCLGAAGTAAVVAAAAEAGVRRVVVTGLGSPTAATGVEWQRGLAARGAVLERSFAAPHTGVLGWPTWLEQIRAVGVEHSVLTGGLGLLPDPPAEDGLALLADRLLADGFTEAQVRLMAVHNSRWLAGVDEQRAR